MKSPPPLTTFLAERRWKSYSGVLLSVIRRSFPPLRTHQHTLYLFLRSRSSTLVSSYGRRTMVVVALKSSHASRSVTLFVYVYALGGGGGAKPPCWSSWRSASARRAPA